MRALPKIILISDTRQPSMLPAQTCVAELNNVIEQHWGAMRGDEKSAGQIQIADDTVLIVTALSYRSLLDTRKYYNHLFGKAKRSVAIVFDAFFGKRFVNLPAMIQRYSNYGRLLRSFDTVFSPIQGAIAEQRRNLGANIQFLPFGVDTTLAGLAQTHSVEDQTCGLRPILVNGYGRQPPEISKLLSRNINRVGAGIYHHTDHCQIGLVTDMAAHRAHFWALLTASQFALAYAPERYDPHSRFPCSFVGQRWLEMLSAGCIVIGRRPQASEAETMFDWPDATIELPDDPHAAWEKIETLSLDLAWIAKTSARNRRLCIERHDWRVRLDEIVLPAIV